MQINRNSDLFSAVFSLFAADSSLSAMEPLEQDSILEAAIAHEAVVEKVIQPGKPGRVKYQGVWWSARCLENVTLLPEQTVKVIGRTNLTLLVQPAPQET